MKLPNASKGVKKLFIAEILQLIAVALVLFGTVFLGAALVASYDAADAAAGGLAIGGMLSLIGAGVLPVIAYILMLVGLKQASKDEPDRMGKAFASAICALVLSVLVSISQNLGWGITGFLSFLLTVANICVFVFTIMGVSEMTQNISRQDVADMGPRILTIVVIVYALSFIASLFGPVIGGVAAIVALVLSLVAYITLLLFLGRASSALAQG